MLSRLFKLGLILFFSLGLGGCFFSYHYPVQQGNIIRASQIRQLCPGMRVKKVIRLLGKPLLNNLYYDQRLIYVYTLKSNHHPLIVKRLVIYFRQGRLTHYRSNVLPKAKATRPQRVKTSVLLTKPSKVIAVNMLATKLPAPGKTSIKSALPKPKPLHFTRKKVPLKSQYQKVVAMHHGHLLPSPSKAS